LESLIQDEIDNWRLAGYNQLRTLLTFACWAILCRYVAKLGSVIPTCSMF
jgi:hypothetical protein